MLKDFAAANVQIHEAAQLLQAIDSEARRSEFERYRIRAFARAQRQIEAISDCASPLLLGLDNAEARVLEQLDTVAHRIDVRLGNLMAELMSTLDAAHQGATSSVHFACQDEIGGLVSAVETFKIGSIERGRLEAAQQAEQAMKEQRSRTIDSLISSFETQVTDALQPDSEPPRQGCDRYSGGCRGGGPPRPPCSAWPQWRSRWTTW